MNEQEHINYTRIAEAIEYILHHFKGQPNLEEVAEHIHLSPFHFQRLFTDWAGVSPKKFLQYISVEHAKQLLKDSRTTLSEVAYQTGLSGTGRLHDLFITIEGMTPGEFKNGGQNLSIQYSFAKSLFGSIILASTSKGICYIAFSESEAKGFEALRSYFPHADFKSLSDHHQQNALAVFTNDWTNRKQVQLHLKGTDFQLKVWDALLKIPMGQLSTYGTVAHTINHPKAARAVGTAIGSNPVAFLIPCHRVIQSSGLLGGYMWGTTRKTVLIGWEAAQQHALPDEK